MGEAIEDEGVEQEDVVGVKMGGRCVVWSESEDGRAHGGPGGGGATDEGEDCEEEAA